MANNFPLAINPHLKNHREMFYDYGYPWYVDIQALESAEESDSKRAAFIQQRLLKCDRTNLELTARGPSLPMAPPNPYSDLEMEPCMSLIRTGINTADRVFSAMKSLIKVFSHPRTKARNEIKRKLRDIIALEKASNSNVNAKLTLDNILLSPTDSPTLRCIAGLALDSVDMLGDYSYGHKRCYNPLYAGGCLSFLPSSTGDDSGFLIFPTGSSMSELACANVSFDGGRLGFSESGDFPILSRAEEVICQTSVVKIHDQAYCLYRTKDKVSFCSLDENGSSSTSQPASPDWPKGSTPIFSCLSPFIKGECLLSSSEGAVYIWSASRKTPKEVYRFSPNDDRRGSSRCATHCQFSLSPRTATVTTTDSLSLVDFRQNKHSTNLLTLSGHHQFFPEETITASHRPNPDSHHHLLATELSLCLIDDRFCQSVLTKWNHQLLTPPTMMALLAPVLGTENESIVALASQEYGEVHCYQVHNLGVTVSEAVVQACGCPWRVSKPADIREFALRSGFSTHTQPDEDRLFFPLVGLQLLPDSSSNGMSVIQLTSVGDLFHQDYQTSDSLDRQEKTYSSGIGSHNLSLDPECSEMVCKWISQCESLSLEKIGPLEMPTHPDEKEAAAILFQCVDRPSIIDAFRKAIKTEYGELIDCDRELLGSVKTLDNKCMVCQDANDSEDDDDDVKCGSCLMTLKESKDLVMDLLQDSVVKVPGGSSLDREPGLEISNNAKDYRDADTRLLVNFYHGNDISEELEERDKEILKECQECLSLINPNAAKDEEESAVEMEVEEDDGCSFF